ncbi:ATP-binding protein [Rickettsia amblyommatis]|uniref:ATP-binding protein n=1 Tax=Rickettsia amblyommatis TaxID=33989 RepID=UPI000A476498
MWGARKTGKSTYLKQRFPDSVYIGLLQADIYKVYFQNPERLREELKSKDGISTIIIDEVQKIPLLLDEVHYVIDSNKSLQFILCGSSARRLKSTGSNLLGGRAWIYMFLPLCYSEIKELDWHKIFNHGLIPDHYIASKKIHKYLASYLYDYILSEVQFEANLRKREAFARFLEIIGISNGEMINYSNIARDCGVDAKTVRTYLEILEDMYLGYHLYPYRSRSKRQIITEMPKFYLFDIALSHYLRKYEYQEMTGFNAGKSFAHYVFLELIAYKYLNDKRDELFYWRTKEGYEVDFIFQNNAFEVKIASSIQKNNLKGLLEFSKDSDFKLHVISFEKTKRIINLENKKITIWPIQEFLDTLWNNEI